MIWNVDFTKVYEDEFFSREIYIVIGAKIICLCLLNFPTLLTRLPIEKKYSKEQKFHENSKLFKNIFRAGQNHKVHFLKKMHKNLKEAKFRAKLPPVSVQNQTGQFRTNFSLHQIFIYCFADHKIDMLPTMLSTILIQFIWDSVKMTTLWVGHFNLFSKKLAKKYGFFIKAYF